MSKCPAQWREWAERRRQELLELPTFASQEEAAAWWDRHKWCGLLLMRWGITQPPESRQTLSPEPKGTREKQEENVGMQISEASIEFSEEENDEGFDQDCVYATCADSGDTVGPIWGHGENSVLRALATLTTACSCGASFHEQQQEAE